jgi:aerobic carbon-monoxide dehydrogenase large subunit
VALVEDAAKDGAPKVWDDNPNGNVAFQLMIGDQAATDTAFAKAKHHVKLRIENNRLTPVSMEPRAAIGDYNTAEDSYTLYTSSQNPHGARTEIAYIFHIAENQLRVVSPDVGGGFGLKGGPFPDDALVLWASKKLRRPVKWVATRSEAMMTDHTGRDLVSYGELALDEKGKILAIRSQSLFQVGAYFVGPGMVINARDIRQDICCSVTDRPPTACRGVTLGCRRCLGAVSPLPCGRAGRLNQRFSLVRCRDNPRIPRRRKSAPRTT